MPSNVEPDIHGFTRRNPSAARSHNRLLGICSGTIWFQIVDQAAMQKK
jgi:hypothetical protein